jgi:hypothetical protein
MSTITSVNPGLLVPLNVPQALRSANAPIGAGQPLSKSAGGERLREAFTQFVGETFYGQMIKAMRSTVGKPAYFDGGRAEEVFRGQLDQALAEHMTEASADRFTEPMFRHQFPNRADKATDGGFSASASGLKALDQLPRR